MNLLFIYLFLDVWHVLNALWEALTTCGPQTIISEYLAQNAAGFSSSLSDLPLAKTPEAGFIFNSYAAQNFHVPLMHNG